MTSGVFETSSKYDAKVENQAYIADPDQLKSEIISLQIAKTSLDGRKQLGWPIGKDTRTLGEDAINSVDQVRTRANWHIHASQSKLAHSSFMHNV